MPHKSVLQRKVKKQRIKADPAKKMERLKPPGVHLYYSPSKDEYIVGSSNSEKRINGAFKDSLYCLDFHLRVETYSSFSKYTMCHYTLTGKC